MATNQRLHALAVEVVCLMHGVRNGDPVPCRDLDAAVAELAHEIDGAGDPDDQALLDDAAGILAEALGVCGAVRSVARQASDLAA